MSDICQVISTIGIGSSNYWSLCVLSHSFVIAPGAPWFLFLPGTLVSVVWISLVANSVAVDFILSVWV